MLFYFISGWAWSVDIMQPTHSTKLSSSQTSLQNQWVKEERSHGRSCLSVSSSSSRSGLDQISCLWQSCSCCGKTRQDFVTKLKLHKIFSYLTKMSFWDRAGCVWIKLKKMITSSQEIHQTVLIFSPDKVFWVSKFWPVLLKDNWYFQLQTAVLRAVSSQCLFRRQGRWWAASDCICYQNTLLRVANHIMERWDINCKVKSRFATKLFQK